MLTSLACNSLEFTILNVYVELVLIVVGVNDIDPVIVPPLQVEMIHKNKIVKTIIFGTFLYY